ncbi:MAG: outer membrane beta-barrel protein [Bacteroidales bacterium]|nr:outer membrane beta-barrel protein [Bacteroidales bacterium]
MNKLNFKKLFLIMILALSPVTFFGQNDNAENNTNNFNDYAYVSGDLGLGLLNGDNSGMKPGLNGHIGIGYQFDNILGIKANLGFGGLNGKFENVNINKSNYFETNLNLTISLTDIILGHNPDRKINLVPHIGIGQVRYRIKLNDNNDNNVYENGYDERDGRKVAATIPMGVELNYAINNNWKVSLDYTANYADTDLIDGLPSGKHNDWFSTINLGASYRLGSEANIFKREDPYCNYWYVMADGGASFLFGDNQYNFANVRGNMNVGIGYDFHNFYRIYAKFGYGIYTGKYDNYFTLDYADYYEANVNIAADLVGFIFGYDEARRYGVYAHLGLGQMQYRARTTFADGSKKYAGYEFENNNNIKGGGINDRRIAMTVPFGIELNYIVNQKFDVYGDITTEYVDSDMLDVMASGIHNDWRTTLNVGLRYKLNNACYAVEEEPECCITIDEVKQAIQDALAEQAANQVKEIDTIETFTIYHTNHASIKFPHNESEKLKSQTNIDAINRASKEIQNGFKIENIIVEGYASPEGGEESNKSLAEDRAKAAAELVQSELNTYLDESHIQIHSNGSDWEGLYNAILGSDINDKKQIVEELKAASEKEETLHKLMRQYPEIEDLLPQLRRANVTITTVKE